MAISIKRILASFVAHAIWGVKWQFLAVSNGLFAVGGSVERTSTPAADRLPEFKASATACSSISGPLPVLIRMAVGFIHSNVSALTNPLVVAVSGQCNDKTSLSLNNVSFSTGVMKSGSSSFFLEVEAITFIPNACATWATAMPMFPNPTMPNVLSANSMRGVSQKQKSLQLLHAPSLTSSV